MAAIVADVGRHPFINEILVWDNDPGAGPFAIDDPRVRVLSSPDNAMCHGRFLCAAQARNPVVYVQDDDALLGNLEELASAFAADPTRIAHALRPGHYAERRLNRHGPCEVALVGWGAFLMRDWVAVLDGVPSPLRRTRLFRREADKFFSILLERHHTPIVGDIRLLGGHSAPGVALWVEPEHRRLSALAVREALRLVRERRAPGRPPPWHVVVLAGGDDALLAESVGSVAGSFADYELSVVEEGDGDGVARVLGRLADTAPRLTRLEWPPGAGHGGARNRAIGAVETASVTCLDAGDRLGPRYLQDAGAVLAGGADIANPDAVLVGTGSGRWAAPSSITAAGVRSHNRIHYAAGFRRTAWAAVGGFGETLDARRANHDFWVRMLDAGARVAPVRGDHFFHRPPGPLARAR